LRYLAKEHRAKQAVDGNTTAERMQYGGPLGRYSRRVSEPAWVWHAIWWQVYPLGFTGAYPATGDTEPHRLNRLTDWLDYAVELGASGIALGPIFASTTHGYDTVDYFRIDPRLGDDADFDALIAATHDRGLRVLLDGVFNHVGRDHPAFQPGSSWFRWEPGTEPGYATFEGHAELPALNHAEPAVADLVVDVMTHWLRRGADGWRLDVAYAVPTSFWAGVLGRVRAEHPDAYVVGEVLHGDYAEFVRDSTVDSVTQYELWKAIWSALNERNFFELSWSLQRHDEFLDAFKPLTFVGNHDVTRIASKLTDERDLAAALVVLCTVGGTPSIYAGDEQAFRGVKEERAGGDDAIRPAFPATPSDLAPYGETVFRMHQELIGLRRRHAWLHDARVRVRQLTNETFVYESTGDGQALQIALNVADAAVDVSVPYISSVIFGDAKLTRGGSEQATARLSPHSAAIFS
jgi:cyclomaltodextrinase / maltogenic alpha-amylase / neopullulanase